jgi:hypothetical protein
VRACSVAEQIWVSRIAQRIAGRWPTSLGLASELLLMGSKVRCVDCLPLHHSDNCCGWMDVAFGAQEKTRRQGATRGRQMAKVPTDESNSTQKGFCLLSKIFENLNFSGPTAKCVGRLLPPPPLQQQQHTVKAARHVLMSQKRIQSST